MDFFLSLDGAKAGPFSIFKVGELIASGEATEETLAWHRGLDGWKPIREVPALETFLEQSVERTPVPPPLPEPPPASRPAEPFPGAPLPSVGPMVATAVEGVATRPRPFVRFWARMFDYALVSAMVSLVVRFEHPRPNEGESVTDFYQRYLVEMQKPEMIHFALTVFLSMIAWHLVEAILIHWIGTTPGKALFGIRIRTQEGERVPLLSSMGRSFYVYVVGMGFHYFPLILIGMIFSLLRLLRAGQSLWDQHLGNRVEHSPLGPFRIVLAICAFFVLLSLQSVSIS